MSFCKIFKVGASTTLLVTVDVIEPDTVVVQQIIQTETAFLKGTINPPSDDDDFTQRMAKACAYVEAITQEDAEREVCDMELSVLRTRAAIQ